MEKELMKRLETLALLRIDHLVTKAKEAQDRGDLDLRDFLVKECKLLATEFDKKEPSIAYIKFIRRSPDDRGF